MKLLATYDDRDEAEDARRNIAGESRLASERDSTVTIYNLFGMPTWGNFMRLGMYDLKSLKDLLEKRSQWSEIDERRHKEILANLNIACKSYGLTIPTHWL